MIGLVFWCAVALIGYVYVGYPIVVTLAALTRRPAVWTDHAPTVTLVVAAWNEESVIAAQLDRLASLDYPRERVQILVAADGSTDATVDLARGFPGVEVVHRPQRRGKMAAIERAVQRASGEVIVTIDANNRLHPDALRLLVAPFGDPRVGVVTGRKTVEGEGAIGFGEGLYWRYEAHLRRMETRLGCTVGVNGELLAVRRQLFSPAPPGTINDDQWMAHRALSDGWDVVFRPEALSTERVSATEAEEAERRSRMVAGQLQVLAGIRLPWRRPLVTWMLLSHKVLRPAVSVAMVVALAASLLALALPGGSGVVGLGHPWDVTAVGVQVAGYAAAAVGDRLPRLGGLGRLPRYLVMENLATLRGMWRHLRGTQPAAWQRASREVS